MLGRGRQPRGPSGQVRKDRWGAHPDSLTCATKKEKNVVEVDLNINYGFRIYSLLIYLYNQNILVCQTLSLAGGFRDGCGPVPASRHSQHHDA